MSWPVAVAAAAAAAAVVVVVAGVGVEAGPRILEITLVHLDALLVTVDFDAIVITRTGAAAEMEGFCVVLYSGLPRILGPPRGLRLPGLAAGLCRPGDLLVLVAGVGVDGEGEGLVAGGRGGGGAGGGGAPVELLHGHCSHQKLGSVRVISPLLECGYHYR